MEIYESQFGLMRGKSTINNIFILTQVMENYRDGQKNIDIMFRYREGLRKISNRRLVNYS